MLFIVVPSLLVVDLVVIILHVIVVPSLADVDLADILAVVVAAAVDTHQKKKKKKGGGDFSFLFRHLYLAVNVFFFLQCSLEQ